MRAKELLEEGTHPVHFTKGILVVRESLCLCRWVHLADQFQLFDKEVMGTFTIMDEKVPVMTCLPKRS